MTDDIFGLGPQRVSDLQDIEKRRVWFDQEEAAAKEEKRVEAAQGELADHLRRRGEAYVEAAGTTPSPATLEAWTVEYTNGKEGRRQEENRRTLQHSEVF
jgi:hypothetical protein